MATAHPIVKHYPPFQVKNPAGLWIEDINLEATEGADPYLYTREQERAFVFNGDLTRRWQNKAGFTLVPVKRNQ